MSKRTYEEVEEQLLLDGYYLKEVSPSGSRYYVALNRPYVRVSDHRPNGPTAKWIRERGVTDIRVASPEDIPAVEPVDETVLGYHQHPAYSRGMLATLANPKEGPRVFEAQYVKRTIPPKDPTIPMMIGSLTHRQVLEPHLDHGIEIIPPEVLNADGHKKGAPWKAFEKANEGKSILKQSEFDEAVSAGIAVRDQLKWIINNPRSLREYEIYWTHDETGLPLRAKLDIILLDADGVLWLPDLKTTANLWRFGKQVADSLLWLQCAHYRAAARFKFGIEPNFWFVAIQVGSVNKVAHVELSPDAMEQADLKYQKLLRELRRRLDENDWVDECEKSSLVLSRRDVFGWKDEEEDG